MGKIIRCNVSQPYITGELWQYDYGKSLLIGGLPGIEDQVSIHFSVHDSEGIVTEVPGTVTDEGILARIPDELLVNNDIAHDYKLFAFVCERGTRNGKTLARLILPVSSRARPDNYPAAES